MCHQEERLPWTDVQASRDRPTDDGLTSHGLTFLRSTRTSGDARSSHAATIRPIGRWSDVARRSTTKPRLDYWLVSRDVSPTFVPGEIHPGRRQSGGRWTVRRTSRPPYGEPLEPGGGEGGAVEVVEEEGPRTCNKLRGRRRRYRRHRCRRHRPRHDVTWIS